MESIHFLSIRNQSCMQFSALTPSPAASRASDISGSQACLHTVYKVIDLVGEEVLLIVLNVMFYICMADACSVKGQPAAKLLNFLINCLL